MATQATSEWVDISVPLRSGMVHWPSDPPVRIERVLDLGRGDSHNVSEISLGSHSGTHMDAPLHFIKNGASISEMPLDIAVGSARVLEIRDTESIKPEELSRYHVRRGERILFKTLNSTNAWRTDEFMKDFVFLSDESAHFLAERKVRLVGIDYLSVGSFRRGGRRAHQALLKAGVWILEGLDLSRVSPGRCQLICLPLRIDHGDGAPARAIVRQL
jgi:arylformamidase